MDRTSLVAAHPSADRFATWGTCAGAVVAFVLLFLELGFPLSSRTERVLSWFELGLVVAFGLGEGALLVTSLSPWERARRHRGGTALFAVVLLVLTGSAVRPEGSPFLHATAMTVALFVLGRVTGWAMRLAAERVRLSPPVLLAATFVGLIGLGTALLGSPRAHAPGRAVSLLDAFFTATSAACVTGLTVVDTGRDFSTFGQLVILGLIQVGGLSLVTLVAFGSVVLGSGISIRQSIVTRDALGYADLGRLRGVLRFVLVTTLLVETAGAFALWLFLPAASYDVARLESPLVRTVFVCGFHSVSAFCNAGFALWPDSLGSFARSRGVLGVIALLVVLGGLGFPVLENLLQLARPRRGRTVRARLLDSLLERETVGAARRPQPRLTVQSRLVLATSVALLVLGTLGLWAFERDASARAMTGPAAWLTCFFHSVSARTAGFNAVDLARLSEGGLFLLIVLMFVGGSSGSTAGGIKTTTLAVLVLSVVAVLRGRDAIEVDRRSIRPRVQSHAVTVALVALALATLATLTLVWLERDLVIAGRPARFLDLLFEVVSAGATVGLTTGVTPALSIPGKLLIALTMFLGRIGPLALVLGLASRRELAPSYTYPETDVQIG